MVSQIQELFPTYIITSDLSQDAEFETANLDLKALAYEYCAIEDPEIKTDNSDANIYTAYRDRPGIIWLEKHITNLVMELAEKYQVEGYTEIKMLGSPQIFPAGEHHSMHPHLHAYTSQFTACYYCDAGDSTDKKGSFRAWDPRWTNMNLFSRHIKNFETITPKTGLIIMWPNIVWHDVSPYIGKQDRIAYRTDISLPHSDFDFPEKY
jgi:hypothetical protein